MHSCEQIVDWQFIPSFRDFHRTRRYNSLSSRVSWTPWSNGRRLFLKNLSTDTDQWWRFSGSLAPNFLGNYLITAPIVEFKYTIDFPFTADQTISRWPQTQPKNTHILCTSSIHFCQIPAHPSQPLEMISGKVAKVVCNWAIGKPQVCANKLCLSSWWSVP